LTTQPGLPYFELPAPATRACVRARKTILPRTGVKWLVMTGSALAVTGQVLLARLSPHGSYAGEIVPCLVLTGLGVSCLSCPATAFEFDSPLRG
jgi:hypothetical protein